MNHQLKISLIGWMARGLSILVVGSILLFVIGECFNPLRLNMQEALLFLFFPLGIVIGIAIGWWREGLGGLITLASMALFYAVHFIQSGRLPKGPFFLIFALPGLLFVISWLYEKISKHRNPNDY